MREAEHRVANLLQIVVNGLERCAATAQDPVACNSILEAASQVQTVAFLQRMLAGDSFADQPFWADRLEELCRLLHDFLFRQRSVNLQFSCQHFALQQVVWRDLALVLNELLVNAAKHGFGTSNEGMVNIDVHHRDGKAICIVQNKSATGSCRPIPEAGYGTRLVRLLARRHGGECTWQFSDSGAIVRVELPAALPTS